LKRTPLIAVVVTLRGRRAIAALLAAIITLISACSLYQRYEAQKPENIQAKETLLTDAGFKRMEIDAAHREQMDGLEANELRYYDSADGRVYWYYDPTVCQCIYVGDNPAYDSYVLAARQQQDIAQYVSESEDADAASLYAFNGAMFPPPIFLFGGGLAAGGAFGGFSGGGHRAGGGGGGFGGGGHASHGGHSGGGHGR
jgi:hypothetical protein